MEDTRNTMNHPMGCSCPSCRNKMNMCGCGCGGYWCGGRRFLLMRWLLGIIAMLLIFCLGVALGELKASVDGGFYGGRHFYMAPMMYDQYQYGPSMMGRVTSPAAPTTQTQTP